MLDPRKTNVAIDANALDHKGGERDALVDRFNAAVKSGTVTVVVAAGVRDELRHPRTPSDAKDAVLPQIYNLRPGLNAAQREVRRQVAIILQGNAKPGTHAADASHISEAAETGCAYFITEDKRMLGKRAEMRLVLPPTLAIVTLEEFFDAFDRG
jgi:predicted nucleic acid-binding protein